MKRKLWIVALTALFIASWGACTQATFEKMGTLASLEEQGILDNVIDDNLLPPEEVVIPSQDDPGDDPGDELPPVDPEEPVVDPEDPAAPPVDPEGEVTPEDPADPPVIPEEPTEPGQKKGKDKDTTEDDSCDDCSGKSSKERVKICHVPPGNHLQSQVLVLPPQAVRAHLQHGGESFDYLLPADTELEKHDWCDPYAEKQP